MIFGPLQIGGLVAIAVAVGGAYLQGRSDGQDVCQAAEARDTHVARVATDAAASAAAGAIAQIKVQHTTIRQAVEREIRENTVYRDCSHSPEQLQRINAAITAGNAPEPEPAGGGKLPRPDAIDRLFLRRDDGQAP